MKDLYINAIDLFCGAGGLTRGLIDAGIKVVAGYDIDGACKYPYEKNNNSAFIKANVGTLSGEDLRKRYSRRSIKLLAGCAPCQPFSTLSNGKKPANDTKWGLLSEFGRLVSEFLPDLVTMENVPRLMSKEPFHQFTRTLLRNGYYLDYLSARCADYGIPQERRRLVLVASKLGPIRLAPPQRKIQTVRDAIESLPHVNAGETHPSDPLHKARALSPLNLCRIRHSRPGGTWHDWPVRLRAACHQKPEGASFKSVYSRMVWDAPSPTMTTQSCNFGTGRFGHPEQDRAITLREAAILQTFPNDYEFAHPDDSISFTTISRLIGNAVPPTLGKMIGQTFIEHIKGYSDGKPKI